MKRVFIITMIAVLVFGVGVMPAKADTPQPFDLVKYCIGNQTCIISSVNPSSNLNFLLNATIKYDDHKMIARDGSFMHEAATFLITTTGGDTAVGHVSWVFVNGEFIGSVTIEPGTGALAGFHASAKVDVISWQTMEFSFTGTYFFAP